MLYDFYNIQRLFFLVFVCHRASSSFVLLKMHSVFLLCCPPPPPTPLLNIKSVLLRDWPLTLTNQNSYFCRSLTKPANVRATTPPHTHTHTHCLPWEQIILCRSVQRGFLRKLTWNSSQAPLAVLSPGQQGGTHSRRSLIDLFLALWLIVSEKHILKGSTGCQAHNKVWYH